MKIIQHGKHTERGMRRVYTCKRCGCIYMPEMIHEEGKTPDGKDYACECPDCGRVNRDYCVENRTVLEVTGPALRDFFKEDK